LRKAEFVEAARSYLGVPFRHLGRNRNGLDCVGLVLCAAHDVGLLGGIDYTTYDRIPDGKMLREIDSRVRFLTKRLEEDALIPEYATHYIGAGGVVLNENRELLVVSELHRRSESPYYKLPGGALHPGEHTDVSIEQLPPTEITLSTALKLTKEIGFFETLRLMTQKPGEAGPTYHVFAKTEIDQPERQARIQRGRGRPCSVSPG